MITSTQPLVTIGSVASLITATLYQGNNDRNHKFWNIGLSERYILHIQVLLECCMRVLTCYSHVETHTSPYVSYAYMEGLGP